MKLIVSSIAGGVSEKISAQQIGQPKGPSLLVMWKVRDFGKEQHVKFSKGLPRGVSPDIYIRQTELKFQQKFISIV